MAVLSKEAVDHAVEIAKAGMSVQTGTLLTNPKIVADFIQTVAERIESLRFAKS